MKFQVNVSNALNGIAFFNGEVLIDNDVIDSDSRSEVEVIKASIRTNFYKLYGADMVVAVERC
ncbi:hypothetical protein SJI19_16745 [Acerihabitans sp. TG2]|uniref:hypothetical protein n=1 Tax=Acerihabitans sp. TG2 TaxID=3096008 RepID=UPI002B22DE52|nr:hypothetical protein [Acerihabitans sp. TG2]MEA9392174.1 hypothetical protein [Acerihabitans sp. TG2]